MILIADGGSTKADWVALNEHKKEVFRIRTLGLNPAVISEKELTNRIINIFQLVAIKDKVTEIYFYGAGCGTTKPKNTLHKVIQNIFTKATISIAEDILGAVYATGGNKPAIVCILGTGSNSCYYNGQEMQIFATSLGYSIMDEASGNYFGKKLLRDYYYKRMPKKIADSFKNKYNLDADFIKTNLYSKPNPNRYLASFAEFMFDFKDKKYIKKHIKKGFKEFFEYRILPYKNLKKTPIYFVGSIAFYFQDILHKTAKKYQLEITDIIQRPIDNLIAYHKKE